MPELDIHLDGDDRWPDLAHKTFITGRLTAIARLVTWAAAHGVPELVRWLVSRLNSGEITIRASKKLDLPSGQALS